MMSVMGLALASPITHRIAEYLDHQPSLCPLQRLAGIPCPSCGGTRAIFYFASGDPINALKRNAAVVIAGVVLGGFYLSQQRDSAISST
jgi:hypothetical protein